MYKKIFTLTLLISIFVVGSNLSISAQTGSGDENQTVSKQIEPKGETLRETLSKTKETTPASDREVKEAMAAYQNHLPKAPGKKLSTKSKILIGVGIAAAALGVAVIVWAAKER